MRLLLIKIGKAWHTLRREGLWRGGQRVLTAATALFRRVPAAQVLFVTGGVGDSARYRTEHVAEELRREGITASTTVQDNPWLSSYADTFSVFVFHRVLFTQSVATLIRKIKEQGKEIIFETDDLVYDPAFLTHMDYYKTMNALERKLYEHGVGGEILADTAVRVATTTTSFLAEKLRERGKQVFVLPNKLSAEDVRWAAEAMESEKKNTEERETVRIAYFSGTLSHNKDFATVVPVLMRLLARYPKTRLVLAGPLDVDDALHRFSGQIERVSFAPRREHFKNIAGVDINIAPLEKDNPFCESKSELKWFEAGIVGVPTVATATRTFREAITDGIDGFVAATEDEWEEKLEKLIVNQEARRLMGERARQTVLERYTTESGINEAYVTYLKAKL